MTNVVTDWDRVCSDVDVLDDLSVVTQNIDALIVAAGFEDRAFKVLPSGRFGVESHCILVKFEGGTEQNADIFEKFYSVACGLFSADRVHVVQLRLNEAHSFETDIGAAIAKLPRTVRVFGIDVSGLPSYAICGALNVVRNHRSEESQYIFYTAASEYIPKREDYDQLVKGNPEEIGLLPQSMALEMAENLVLDTFSGYRSRNAKTCLVVFAGFEAHRSTGVIDAVNPAVLVLLYGKPGVQELEWRLDLSKKLHRKFEKGRRTAVEVTSTLHVKESLKILEEYYNYIIDDYDFAISPVCSKMQVVSTYLFWEKYGETQLTFPIPIGYDPSNSPRGVAKTYSVRLSPRRGLFRRPTEL